MGSSVWIWAGTGDSWPLSFWTKRLRLPKSLTPLHCWSARLSEQLLALGSEWASASLWAVLCSMSVGEMLSGVLLSLGKWDSSIPLQHPRLGCMGEVFLVKYVWWDLLAVWLLCTTALRNASNFFLWSWFGWCWVLLVIGMPLHFVCMYAGGGFPFGAAPELPVNCISQLGCPWFQVSPKQPKLRQEKDAVSPQNGHFPTRAPIEKPQVPLDIRSRLPARTAATRPAEAAGQGTARPQDRAAAAAHLRGSATKCAPRRWGAARGRAARPGPARN